VQSNEDALRLMQLRFTNGRANNLEVLEARQRLYSSQLALDQTEVNRRLILVQLYKALGGGWNLTDAQWMAANSQPAAQTPPPSTKP
jgi:outer membrane protein, multidrug efflux system